ncbi:MAG: prepilin-type N-terminal cleavage/methylation domain-containing protein [Rickettsiales bacterium]|nr:prepilin-type N-terminal cleavage/methylation domain-containing protein [Rickettsiales bacterium]
MNKSKKLNKAFSLIELSIVILIIGILIAGVTQGQNLVTKSKLKTAQNLTKSSPVSGIKDLALWYETSLESSFLSSEALDNTAISVWYDNNPHKTIKNNLTNATQSNATFKPKFYENIFANGIPGIRFDNSNDYMSFNGDFLIQTEYTAFTVCQKTNTTNWDMVLGGGIASNNASFAFGYDQLNNQSVIGSYGYIASATDSSLTIQNNARIFSGSLSRTSGTSLWIDGNGSGSLYNNNSSATTLILPSSNLGSTMTIGYYPPTTTYFGGYIAEIIVFTRNLKYEERKAVEKYLGQKYNITVSP